MVYSGAYHGRFGVWGHATVGLGHAARWNRPCKVASRSNRSAKVDSSPKAWWQQQQQRTYSTSLSDCVGSLEMPLNIFWLYMQYLLASHICQNEWISQTSNALDQIWHLVVQCHDAYIIGTLRNILRRFVICHFAPTTRCDAVSLNLVEFV
jgi:hypothetical protein